MPNVEVVNATPQGQLVVVIEEDDKSTGALLKNTTMNEQAPEEKSEKFLEESGPLFGSLLLAAP
jgi:hypothetical protein